MSETDINELNGKSPNFRTELAKQLEELVPEAIGDGKVNVEKLKELLDDDATRGAERFGLNWPGKRQAIRAAQEPTTATLKPAPELSKDWDATENIFIEGDNLEVLKVLQKQYHNKIKMIYIDPPYNTGKDFVYPDNYKEGLANYLEFSKQVDEGGKKVSTNTDTQGRYHSNWLNMMYPRLKLARNLLTDDGVIFISIGEAENDNLRKLCNEIFGENNYIGQIIPISNPRGSQEPYGISSVHEYIICYSRSAVGLSSIEGYSRKDEGEFNFIMPDGRRARLLGLRKRGGDWKRSDRPNMFFPFYVNPDNLAISLTSDEAHTVEVLPKRPTGEESRWTWGYDTSEKRLGELTARPVTRDGEVEYNIFRMDPLEDENGIEKRQKMKSLWDDKNLNYQNARVLFKELFGNSELFDFPKPVELIDKMLRAISDSNYYILDFFSGSGTTAHAVMQLNAEDGGNRKHIQVQLPEPTDEKSEAYKAGYRKISDIARERIHRAGEKIKADHADKLAERDTPLDTGYRTYKLADTNFTKWKSDPIDSGDVTELQTRFDLMRESANDSASQADLLTEILLKMGLPLTTRTIERTVDGLVVYQVVADAKDDEANDTQPIFYLDEHTKPTLEQLRAIMELTPSKFVIIDDCFQGDDQLKTNLVQTCKSYDVELWTV